VCTEVNGRCGAALRGRAAEVSEKISRVSTYGVGKTFGATVALRAVNMSLECGRLTLIEGPNGSGKSTLLGILGTVLKPTVGRVEYGALGDDLQAARACIGWVSHETMAYPDLTGRENLELAARLHGCDPQAAWAEAEERFDLGSFARRPVRTNSRGQRQRVALARALVHRPSLLLLDEPTTGLDKASVRRLIEVVLEEVQRDSIVAVVTHEPESFPREGAARVVLERGRVTVGGRPRSRSGASAAR